MADPRVEERLLGERLRDRHLLAGYPDGPATLDEQGDVVRVVFGGDHEEPAGVLDAVRHDPAQHAVLLDALLRRLGVLHGVAPAGVEEAVVAPGGAVAQVALLDQEGVEAAHRQVTKDPGAGGAATDHQHPGRDTPHVGDHSSVCGGSPG